MVVSCQEVWREISNYLDDQVEPGLRAAMEEHIRGCKRCTAVLDGARNVIQLYADERMVEVPLGFDRRLQRRLEGDIEGGRRWFLGWMVAAAAGVLAVGGFELAKSSVSHNQAQRSEHAQPSNHVPPDMMVVVADDGKLFHLAGCSLIHDKAKLRSIAARQAMKEGYTPCTRCLKKYLI
jgi:Putative zinc-finger